MAAPAPILDFTGLPVVASDRSLFEFKPNDLSLQSVTYQNLYLYMGLLVWIGEGLCVLGRGSCYRNLRCERFIVLKTSFSRQNLWMVVTLPYDTLTEFKMLNFDVFCKLAIEDPLVLGDLQESHSHE